MTDVIAQLHRSGTNESATATIAALETQLGLPIRPLHPGTTDPELAVWVHVAIPSWQDAGAVVGALLADTAVAAAYVKPPDAAPEAAEN